MKVPFTWKVTGWFMVGWSPEFPVGEVRPLRYFGEDLVAYRDESGELQYPRRTDTAPESVLAEHLAEAHALFDFVDREIANEPTIREQTLVPGGAVQVVDEPHKGLVRARHAGLARHFPAGGDWLAHGLRTHCCLAGCHW